MTVWFVSRHPGAIEWIQSQLISIDRFVPHLDVTEIKRGDVVYGTLPVNLAWRIIEQGARYKHLNVHLPNHLRGQELTATQLVSCGAHFSEYHITCVAL